jgi:rubrerythrin
MTETYSAIETVDEFLVHALELEQESAERYHQLAQSMEIHHNHEVAELFEHLAIISEEHARDVEERAVGLILPNIAPWEFKWNCPGSPESQCLEFEANYLMTALEALTLALHNEIRGRDFYAHVAMSSPHPAVRHLAGEMEEEEDEHVDLLKDWFVKESHSCSRGPAPVDLDPPNTPE